MTIEQIRKKDHDLIKVGKIARWISTEDPKNFSEELYLVVGFQVDIYGHENFVVLINDNSKVFIAHKDNIVIQEKLKIEDMFPTEPTDIMIIYRKRDYLETV